MTAFIDTNVLIYGQEAGAKSETARRVILAGGVISVQVLNEFAAVLRRKFGLEWAVIADSLADVRTALDPVRPIGVEIHTSAVALARSHGFSFHDALMELDRLVADLFGMSEDDLNYIVSAMTNDDKALGQSPSDR